MSLEASHRDLLPRRSLTKHSIVLDLDETLVHTEESLQSLKRMNFLKDPQLLYVRQDSYILHLDGDETRIEVPWSEIPSGIPLDIPMDSFRNPEDFPEEDLRAEGIEIEEEAGMKMWGTKRYYLDQFLLFCFTYFQHVLVWSAGQKEYVHRVVDHLFREFRPPDFVLTFDDCEENVLGDHEKPLEKLVQLSEGRLSLEHTFVLDDRKHTFRQNPDNAIWIPPYSPYSLEGITQEDPTLIQLRSWFLLPSVRRSTDVRTLDKTTIFDWTPEEYIQQLEAMYS